MVPTHGNLDYFIKSAHFIVEEHINTTATHPETGHRHNPLYNSLKIVPCASRSGIVGTFLADGNPSEFCCHWKSEWVRWMCWMHCWLQSAEFHCRWKCVEVHPEFHDGLVVRNVGERSRRRSGPRLDAEEAGLFGANVYSTKRDSPPCVRVTISHSISWTSSVIQVWCCLKQYL